MNYKVGDTPRVHTLEWFEKNCEKDNSDYVCKGSRWFVYNFSDCMKKYFGEKVKIKKVDSDKSYKIEGSTNAWDDWMFESPEEHKTLAETLGDILQEISKTKRDISHNIVFISGSITNDKNYKQKFAALEQKLIAKGCIVLNPAFLPEGMEHDAYMPICYAMIDQSETIVFMNDWRKSDGAKVEMVHAINKNKRIVFEEEI